MKFQETVARLSCFATSLLSVYLGCPFGGTPAKGADIDLSMPTPGKHCRNNLRRWTRIAISSSHILSVSKSGDDRTAMTSST
jgi:hypothetical protein